MSEFNRMNNAFISDEAIAGMIAATAIPTIAGAIVKAGEMGAGAVAGAFSSSAQQATTAASAASQGNFAMGNASLGNQSADNLSMGQVNTRSSIKQGGVAWEGSDMVGHTQGSGGEIINNSAAFQNLGVNLNASGRTSASLTRASEQSEQAARTDLVSAGQSINAAFQQAENWITEHGKNNRAGDTSSLNSSAQFLQAVADQKRIADQYGNKNELGQQEQAQVEAFARAEAGGGLHIPGVGGVDVKGGVGVKGSFSAASRKVQEVAHQLAQNKEFRDAVQRSDTATRQKDFAKGEDSASRGAKSVNASLQQSKTHMESSAANHIRADAYRQAATQTQEHAASFDSNANNQFMDWMRGQKNEFSGNNFTASDVAAMAREHKLDDYAQRFADEVLAKDAMKGVPDPENSVAATHEANKQDIGSDDGVKDFYDQGAGRVQEKQNKDGINPNTGPKDTVTRETQKKLGNADQQIHDGKKDIDEKGKPLKDNAEHANDPKNQNLMGQAVSNAASSVMPDGTTKLLNDMGLVADNAAFAKPAAENYKGTTKDAVVDTALAVGSFALGGVAGKVAGKALEPLMGKVAGDAAAATTEKVEAAAARRLAELGERRAATAEGKAAAKAAPVQTVEQQAAKREAEDIAKEKRISNAGGKAEVEAEQTVTGIGTAAGAIGGGLTAKHFAGDQGILNHDGVKPVVEKAEDLSQRTLQATHDVLHEVGDEAGKLGNAARATSGELLGKAGQLGERVVEGIKETDSQVKNMVGLSGNSPPPAQNVSSGKIVRRDEPQR